MNQAPAVVFVHGLRTSHTIWAAQERALAQSEYESIAVDLPGHGVLRHQAFTLSGARAVIDDALSTLDAQQPVILVGLSLGGYTVLDYAAQRPGAVAGVVACACSSDPARKPLLAFRNFTSGIDRLMHGSSQPRQHASDLDGVDQGDRGTVGDRPSWSVVAEALTELAGTSSLANLRSIKAPVWLINGRWDHLRWESRRYLRARPDATEHVIRGAAHDVNTDAPADFNRVLLSILATVRPVTPSIVGTAQTLVGPTLRVRSAALAGTAASTV